MGHTKKKTERKDGVEGGIKRPPSTARPLTTSCHPDQVSSPRLTGREYGSFWDMIFHGVTDICVNDDSSPATEVTWQG